MPETSNLARKYTNICIFRKNNFQYQDSFNFADVSIFMKKNQHLLAKILLYTLAIPLLDFIQAIFAEPRFS